MLKKKSKLFRFPMLRLLIVAILVGASSQAFAQTVSFPSRVTYPVGILANAVRTADFNKDGKLDFAIVDGSSQKFSVFLGDGHGSFGAPISQTVHAGEWLG